MVINDTIKSVITGSAFISIITLGADGTPHPIVVGKGQIEGDNVVFGVFKMETTRKNLAANPNAWILAATMDGGPKGYRLSGTATVNEKQIIFTPAKAEPLI